jgi:hypothetical protein
MKGCAVLARTVWFVTIGLLVGRPTFRQLTSPDVRGTATGLAGAIITNASIAIDKVATHPVGVALNHAGRQIC